jgi:hypothetical protein
MPTSETPDVGVDNQALVQDRVDDIGQTRRGRPATCSARCLYSSSHRYPLVLHFFPLVPASTPCQRGIICRLGSILRRQHKNFAEATQDQPKPAHPGTNSPGQTLRQLRGDPTACSHRHFLRSATQGTEHQTVASAIACGLPLLIPGRLRPPALLVTLKVARYACRGGHGRS